MVVSVFGSTNEDNGLRPKANAPISVTHSGITNVVILLLLKA